MKKYLDLIHLRFWCWIWNISNCKPEDFYHKLLNILGNMSPSTSLSNNLLVLRHDLGLKLIIDKLIITLAEMNLRPTMYQSKTRRSQVKSVLKGIININNGFFHIKYFSGLSVTYIWQKLVLGDVPVGLDHGLNPPGHGVSEGVEEGRVLGQLLPGLGDGLGQLREVWAGWHVPDDPVETSP